LQITADAGRDMPIPGKSYGYQTLVQAQALGDLESLQQHGRPALQIHLEDESSETLEKLARLIESVAGAQPSAVS
jgi:transaldolase/glucose-6-phosphate isomerase